MCGADKTRSFLQTLATKSLVKGENCTGGKMKTYSVIMWEYLERNGISSCDSKSSKTKIFQEPEN
jgi:hypothetical protein